VVALDFLNSSIPYADVERIPDIGIPGLQVEGPDFQVYSVPAREECHPGSKKHMHTRIGALLQTEKS
jgi:hypothetical protein